MTAILSPLSDASGEARWMKSIPALDRGRVADSRNAVGRILGRLFRRHLRTLLAALVLASFCLYTTVRVHKSIKNKGPETNPFRHELKTLSQKPTASLSWPQIDFVVASISGEDTRWIADDLVAEFPNVRPMVYVTDDSKAPLTVPANKGNEAMVYITYLVDNYHRLPDFAVFNHAGRLQWHNDDPQTDGLQVFRRLQWPYIQEQGYVNLRCVWTYGCPSEVLPHNYTNLPVWSPQVPFYKQAFNEIFPGISVPEVVAQPCCGQFVVTREQIRKRRLSEYRHMQDWLMRSELENMLTGRIFEYLWHIMFGRPAVFCPDAEQCYCKLFGRCGLECDAEHGTCVQENNGEGGERKDEKKEGEADKAENNEGGSDEA